MGDEENYGSFAVLGNLSITISGVNSSSYYNRSLDLATGLHTTTYRNNASQMQRLVKASGIFSSMLMVHQQLGILLLSRQRVRLSIIFVLGPPPNHHWV